MRPLYFRSLTSQAPLSLVFWPESSITSGQTTHFWTAHARTTSVRARQRNISRLPPPPPPPLCTVPDAMPKVKSAASNPTSRPNRPIPKKNWCFTINNYSAAHLAIFPLPKDIVKYCKYGKETGEEGTRHLQGYLQLWKPKRLLQVRALLNPSGTLSWPHIEAQLSPSNKVADDYCSKEDPEPFVQGTLTLTANDARQRDSASTTRRLIFESLRRGDPLPQIADDHPEELSYLHTAARYGKPRAHRAKVLYLHGATGCGKTTSTTNVLLELDMSWHKKLPASHWFDGYIGQKVLVLEEFQSCFPLVSFLSLCDSYPPPVLSF